MLFRNILVHEAARMKGVPIHFKSSTATSTITTSTIDQEEVLSQEQSQTQIQVQVQAQAPSQNQIVVLPGTSTITTSMVPQGQTPIQAQEQLQSQNTSSNPILDHEQMGRPAKINNRRSAYQEYSAGISDEQTENLPENLSSGHAVDFSMAKKRPRIVAPSDRKTRSQNRDLY